MASSSQNVRYISGIVGISEETYATRRSEHPLFDSKPFAVMDRSINHFEMRDLPKYFPQHLARSIRWTIQHNQNLIRETCRGEIFIESPQRLRESFGLVVGRNNRGE